MDLVKGGNQEQTTNMQRNIQRRHALTKEQPKKAMPVRGLPLTTADKIESCRVQALEYFNDLFSSKRLKINIEKRGGGYYSCTAATNSGIGKLHIVLSLWSSPQCTHSFRYPLDKNRYCRLSNSSCKPCDVGILNWHLNSTELISDNRTIFKLSCSNSSSYKVKQTKNAIDLLKNNTKESIIMQLMLELKDKLKVFNYDTALYDNTFVHTFISKNLPPILVRGDKLTIQLKDPVCTKINIGDPEFIEKTANNIKEVMIKLLDERSHEYKKLYNRTNAKTKRLKKEWG